VMFTFGAGVVVVSAAGDEVGVAQLTVRMAAAIGAAPAMSLYMNVWPVTLSETTCRIGANAGFPTARAPGPHVTMARRAIVWDFES